MKDNLIKELKKQWYIIRNYSVLWIAISAVCIVFGEDISSYINFTKPDKAKDILLIVIAIVYLMYFIKKALSKTLNITILIYNICVLVSYFFVIRCLLEHKFTRLAFCDSIAYFDVVVSIIILQSLKWSNKKPRASLVRTEQSSYETEYVIHQDTETRDLLNRKDNVDLIYDYLIANSAKNGRKSSTNIAIKGDWGIGKSYIKEALIDKLEKTTVNKNFISYVIEFKPWASNKNDDINERFFQDINYVLKDQDPALSAKFHQYFNTFFNVSNSYIVNSIKLLRDWLYPKISKEDLSKYLKDEAKIIYVFIDDIDRLEKEEILELFKFIRNNGSIPNVVYTLLFDEQHVQKKLGYNGDNPNELSEYFSKFFNLEINMTSGELEHITLFEEFLLKQIENKNTKASIEKVVQSLLSLNAEYLYFLFGNIRYIKSFSNRFLFLLNLKKPLIDSCYISTQDLFVLEIIRYKYPQLYRGLKQIEYNGNIIERIENSVNAFSDNHKRIESKVLAKLKESLVNERNTVVVYDYPNQHNNRLRIISNHAVYFNDNYNHQFNAKTINQSLNTPKEFYEFINYHIDMKETMSILFDHKNYWSNENRQKLVIYLISDENLYETTKKSILQFLCYDEPFFEYFVDNITVDIGDGLILAERITYIIRYSFTLINYEFTSQLIQKGLTLIYETLNSIGKVNENEVALFLKIFSRTQFTFSHNTQINHDAILSAIETFKESGVHILNDLLDFLPVKVNRVDKKLPKTTPWKLDELLVQLFIANNGLLAHQLYEFRKYFDKYPKASQAMEITRDLILKTLISYINKPQNEYILLKEDDIEYLNYEIQDRLLSLESLRDNKLTDY